MGIFGSIFNRTAPAPTTTAPEEYIPATQPTMRDRLASGTSAVVDKATQIYKQNPKLVGSLAVLAGAAVLAGMKRRGRI